MASKSAKNMNEISKHEHLQEMIDAANYVRDLSTRFSIFDIAESDLTDKDKDILIKACFLKTQETQQELIEQGVY